MLNESTDPTPRPLGGDQPPPRPDHPCRSGGLLQALTRRQFLRAGAAGTTVSMMLPWSGMRSAWGQEATDAEEQDPQASLNRRVLVVIELVGGNDGLNTVVPYSVRDYYRMRPQIAIDAQQALRLRQVEGIGLHPEMGPIQWLLDEGLANIVLGVGYTKPNRSHEASRRIWHTADPTATAASATTGWLDRAFVKPIALGEHDSPNVFRHVAVGRELPLMLQGPDSHAVVIHDPQQCHWSGTELNEVIAQIYRKIQGESPTQAMVTDPVAGDDTLDHIIAVSKRADGLAEHFATVVLPPVRTNFVGGRLADQLRLVSRLIQADLPVRVYHVRLDGFDTHTRQADQHASSLAHFATGVRAFIEELTAINKLDEVLTVAFSEFGREVQQNASDGTDHGAAGPMFLFGDAVEPGLIGNHPSLTDLEDGGLRHTTDFRSVYAAILNQWWGLDSTTVLGTAVKPVKVLKS